MNHGDHSGHGGGHSMPMPMDPDVPACSMNMLWNNQVADTCVVFRSWHISGPTTMFVSCIAVVLISLFYSYLLHYIRTYDLKIALSISQTSSSHHSSGPGSMPGSRNGSLIPPIPSGYNSVNVEGGSGSGALSKMGLIKLPLQTRIARGALSALSVAISFWLMLVAMTYNTYLFSSIVVGAFLGHIIYEGEMDVTSILSGGAGGKGLACH